MSVKKGSPLASIPRVDDLVRASDCLVGSLRNSVLRKDVHLRLAREVLERHRADVRTGKEPKTVDDLAAEVRVRVNGLASPGLRRVINATGVILNTNLGRAPMGFMAANMMGMAAMSACALEVDLLEGQRGERGTHIARLLQALTGAADSLAVNNNAAAVLLILETFARGKAVVVSRGELVEIGGGFRVPDVLARSGAKLIEVGTTNKTRLSDFAAVDHPDVAAYLCVHPSNFRIEGFTESVPHSELTALARTRGVLSIHDLGSGDLRMMDRTEPSRGRSDSVMVSVEAGFDLVTFSGDKMLGGPQAGLIVGREDLIARLRSDPLYRALRCGKNTLAGLAATLSEHLAEDASTNIPCLAMIERSPEQRQALATNLAATLSERCQGMGASFSVVATRGQVGGGAMPGHGFPSFAVAIDFTGASALELSRRLRTLPKVPVVARIDTNRVLLDVAAIVDGGVGTKSDEYFLIGSVARALKNEFAPEVVTMSADVLADFRALLGDANIGGYKGKQAPS